MLRDRAVLLNAPGLLTLMLLTGFCGLIMFAHFKDCDPLENGQIWASDQVIIVYIISLGIKGCIYHITNCKLRNAKNVE